MKQFISIIVPVEPEGDVKCVIKALENIEYPKDSFEVIIVEGRNPSYQRNEAVKIAKGEIVHFLDSDSMASPQLLNEIIKCFNGPKVAVVGGPNLPPFDQSFLQSAISAVLESFFGSFSVRSRYKSIGETRESSEKELILCNMSFKKEIFSLMGGFNEKLYPNEENEFLNKIKDKGYKLIYSPHAIVYRERRSSIIGFFKQAFRYGLGRMQQIFSYPKFSDAIHAVPFIFFIYLFSLLFFHPVYYIVPLFMYIALCLYFSLVILFDKKNPILIGVIPVLFFIRHIAYGIGFGYGIFNREKRKTLDTDISFKGIADLKK